MPIDKRLIRNYAVGSNGVPTITLRPGAIAAPSSISISGEFKDALNGALIFPRLGASFIRKNPLSVGAWINELGSVAGLFGPTGTETVFRIGAKWVDPRFGEEWDKRGRPFISQMGRNDTWLKAYAVEKFRQFASSPPRGAFATPSSLAALVSRRRVPMSQPSVLTRSREVPTTRQSIGHETVRLLRRSPNADVAPNYSVWASHLHDQRTRALHRVAGARA
jgi:hypothetical protein